MSPLAGKTILVVDDEIDIVELVGEYLSARGSQTVLSNLPKEALKIAQSQRLDAIVSDMRMPELDGVGLLAAIKETVKPMPVFVFMTGQSSLTAAETLAMGAYAFVPKPVKFEDLEKALISALLPKPDISTRKSKRLRCSIDARFVFGQEKQVVQTKLWNISSGGFFAELDSIEPVDRDTEISFIISEAEGQELRGKAHIRWNRSFSTLEIPAGFGAEFKDVDGQIIQRVISTLGSDSDNH